MPDDEQREPEQPDDERVDDEHDEHDRDDGEHDARAADDEDEGRLGELQATAEAETERLRHGRTVSFFGDPLPVRSLIAIAVFVVVFLLVWSALWATGGGLGLGLGWIPAAAVAALAVAVLGRIVWGEPADDRETTRGGASRA